MNKEELTRKYFLAKNGTYEAIRAEALNYIVACSKTGLSPEKIQGMLLLLGEIDSWTSDFEKEKERTRKEN